MYDDAIGSLGGPARTALLIRDLDLRMIDLRVNSSWSKEEAVPL